MSQDWKNLRPTLKNFGLLFGPKLLINAEALAQRVANWLPKFIGIPFLGLEPIQSHKFSAFINIPHGKNSPQ
jgi:hypothetical protein